MRILYVTGTFLPVRGGVPYYIHYLSKHLERRGHVCRVVTTDMGGEPEIETVECDRAAAVTVAGAPLAPSFPAVLHRSMAAFEPDIIHANYPLPFYPDVAVALARVRSCPSVLTCHGAFDMAFDSVAGLVGNVYNRSLLRVTLRLADRLHVSNRRIIREFGYYRQYEDKASVIPIGIDTEWFMPEKVSGDPPYPVAGDEDTILYVGAFRRYKGLPDLIRAFANLDNGGRLILLGEGTDHEQLQRLATRHGIADRVSFVGSVDDHALRRAYVHADVFVLPSPTMEESYGIVALEAMAMDVPVIVTSGSGMGHVLGDEQAGTVVPPNDPDALANAINDLLEDDEYATQERRAGRELVESRFTWASIIDEYLEMYETLLE